MGKTRKDRKDRDFDYKEDSKHKRRYKRNGRDFDDEPYDWKDIKNVPTDDILPKDCLV